MSCMWFCFGKRHGCGSASVTAASCYAVATSWKFSEAPCVDSSWAHFVFSNLDFRSLLDFWSQIKAVAPWLPHSHFCVISSKFLLLVVGTIILQWLPCREFPTRAGTRAFRFVLLHTGGYEHHFREHLGTLPGGCSAGCPSEYLIWH